MSISTWQNNVKTPIPGDVNPTAVVKILHDHDFILSLNQIVTDHKKTGQEGERQIYNVTESIPIIPAIWKRSVNFEAQFENKDDGVWTWVDAPMGVKMHAKYFVKHAEEGGVEGGWVLEEEIETSCNMFLKGFVEKTMLNSHRNMHKRFIERAREAKTDDAKPQPQS